jgi:Flp pilus assembly protein TadG
MGSKRLRTDTRGGVSVMFAFAVIPLIVAMGAAVDYSVASQIEGELQDALDAAVLAGAASNATYGEDRLIEAQATFDANFLRDIPAAPVFEMGDGTITGTIVMEVPTAFMGVVGIDAVDVSVRATAIHAPGLPICVLALNPTATHGIEIEGTTTLHAVNCAVHANSNRAAALDASGGGTGWATGFCARGGYIGEGWSPAPRSGCSYVPDPFDGLAVPTDLACDYNNKKLNNGTHTISPGVYCGGLDVLAHAIVTMEPGLYIMKNGPLTLHAWSEIHGFGVTTYFYGTNSVLDHYSGSLIDLTAPTAGDYAGIAMAQHFASSVGLTSSLAGGPGIRIVGSLYFPTQILDMKGGADYAGVSPYMPLVADQIIMRGNSLITVEVDLTLAGYEDVLAKMGEGVRLIE